MEATIITFNPRKGKQGMLNNNDNVGSTKNLITNIN